MRRTLFFILVTVTVVSSSRSQSRDIYEKYGIYRNPLRLFLNQFSWTVSTGYGLTFYKHDLTGFYFYQDRDTQLILRNDQESPAGSLFEGYGGWLNAPYEGDPVVLTLEDPYNIPYGHLDNPVNNPALAERQFFADDTLGLSFSAPVSSMPVLASVHYDYKRFRVGLGFQYTRHWMKPLKPSVLRDMIRPYAPGFKTTSDTRFFGLLGYRFYEYWDYTFVAELQVGKINYGRQFDSEAFRSGLYANIGVNIERNFSEYLRLIIRPAFDIKRYTITLPDASVINHHNSAFMVQVGLSLNIPEIPRSPYKSDHVQLKHVITDPVTGRLMEVRGQPLWKKQNPKVGENHRRLWRYKLKNRRKIDPY